MRAPTPSSESHRIPALGDILPLGFCPFLGLCVTHLLCGSHPRRVFIATSINTPSGRVSGVSILWRPQGLSELIHFDRFHPYCPKPTWADCDRHARQVRGTDTHEDTQPWVCPRAGLCPARDPESSSRGREAHGGRALVIQQDRHSGLLRSS